MWRCAKIGGLILFVSGLTTTLFAADTQNVQFTATELHEVDSDFFLQGEYYGQIDTGGGVPWHRVGIQVIAKGDGQFEGVEYSGGLPGSGWNGGDKIKLTGFRQGDAVLLRGNDHNFVIENNYALAFYPGWQPVGQIAKVMRQSPTLGLEAPWGSRILFDGSSTEHFRGGKMTYDGLLPAGTEFAHTYEDFTLHVEFLLPYMPYARGQGRSNSGVYLQSRYELQILDSFGLEGLDNECGGLYRYRAPEVNACLPPLSWQTYDIEFTSPRFDLSGKKIRSARVTAWLNGVMVHNNVEIERKTGGGAEETPELLPIKLQFHGNPVRFRNIWIVDRRESPSYAGPTLQSVAARPVGPRPLVPRYGQQPFPATAFEASGYYYRYGHNQTPWIR